MEKIKSIFEDNVEPMISITRMNGGLSNNMFLINSTYVWKQFSNDLTDPSIEMLIMNKLDYYIVMYHDNQNICYKLIPGCSISLMEYRYNLEIIVKEIKKIHNIKIKTEHFWEKTIPSWFKNVFDIETKDLINKKYNIINELFKRNFKKEENVFCHNDVLNGNILKNKEKLYFIDWEFSGTNNLFCELGNILCEYCCNYDLQQYNFNQINSDLKNNILKAYNLEINPSNIYKLELGILASHFLWWVYSIILLKNPVAGDFDYKKFRDRRLKELNKILKLVDT